MATRHAHPVNRTLIEEVPLGARFADAITGFMGRWKFIVVQALNSRDRHGNTDCQEIPSDEVYSRSCSC